jgi:hypothetical protein
MGSPTGIATFAEVHLMHFSDDGTDRLYVVEFSDDFGFLVKSEYYKNKKTAYEAAAEVNEKNY